MCYANLNQGVGAMMEQRMGFTRDANGNMVPPGQAQQQPTGAAAKPSLAIPQPAATGQAAAVKTQTPTRLDATTVAPTAATQLGSVSMGSGLNIPQ